MKSIYRKILAALTAVFLAAAAPAAVFFLRAPVLIVSDAPFAALYGQRRLMRRQMRASLALFRRVKPVIVADSAGPDVLMFAVEETAKKPHCVLFPRRFAEGALRYREQFPEIPAALLEGGIPDESGNGGAAGTENFFVYRTARKLDMYRAGRIAGIAGGRPDRREKKPADAPDAESRSPARKNIALFYGKFLQPEEQELFRQGVQAAAQEAEPAFYTSASQTTDITSIACAVISGGGYDYLDRSPESPVVLFSWMDPVQTSREVVVVFDDSPWAQAVPAVHLLERGQAAAEIPSEILIFSSKIADNGILRKLRKAAFAKPDSPESAKPAASADFQSGGGSNSSAADENYIVKVDKTLIKKYN